MTEARRCKSAEGSTLAAPRDPCTYAAEAFRQFLSENFRSAGQVARCFFVDERTARNWLAGTHPPRGHIVMMAFGMYPDSAARHLRLAVDNPEPIDRPQPQVSRVA